MDGKLKWHVIGMARFSPGLASLKRQPARVLNEIETCVCGVPTRLTIIAPFGDAYEKIETIQRRLAWPLHKDDTLFQSGRPTGLNIYFSSFAYHFIIS
jgi:hypothetical protein